MVVYDAGMVSQVDDSIGLITEALSHKGILDNTVIAMTSDVSRHTDFLSGAWPFKSLHGQRALCGKGCPAWQGGGLNHYTDKGLYVGRGVQPGRVGV